MDLQDPENLSPARKAVEIHRGIVRAYDSTNHQADVMIYGSMSRVVLSVPVSHSIGAELMAVGADCGVIFFAPGDTGVVVCTFTGAPDPWITSALIKDGEVAIADLAFSRPMVQTASTTSTQVLTTSNVIYSTLQLTIVVPAGETYKYLLQANVEFGCSSYTNWNLDMLRLGAGGSLVGGIQEMRTQSATSRSSVSCAWAGTLSAGSKTVEAIVLKSLARNTENAYRGHLVVTYWQSV